MALLVSCAPDRAASRPDDFGILFETGNGFRLDTFEGRVTKDLHDGTDSTIALELTPAELDTLYQTVRSKRILDLPEPHPAGTPSGVQPWTTFEMRVRAHGRTRNFHWESGLEGSQEEWKRLRSLMVMIWRMVGRDSAYRALPPEAMYL